MIPVLFHRDARSELDEAIAYYEQQSEGLGLDLLNEVQSAVSDISRSPRRWPPHRITPFRKYLLNRFPYVIFYMERDGAIWIAAIPHQKRRPNYWRRRRME